MNRPVSSSYPRVARDRFDSGTIASRYPLLGRIGGKAAVWMVNRISEILAGEGLMSCLRRVGRKARRILTGHGSPLPFSMQSLDDQYQRWRQLHALTPRLIQEMHDTVQVLPYRPSFSLVIVILNPEPRWLREAIESIRKQVYGNYDLHLVCDVALTGSVENLLRIWKVEDPRIKVCSVQMGHKTGLIWRAVFQELRGEFVGLVGQHDKLAPDALFAVVEALNEAPDTHLFYSDEDVIGPDGEHSEPFFKPDWSPDLHLSMNYIDRLCVFRRNTLLDVRLLDTGAEAVGMYDLLLQLTERTEKIAHLPKVLYHTRSCSTTASSSACGTVLTEDDGSVAILRALRRRGLTGRVTRLDTDKFRIAYALRARPLVSIIVPTQDRPDFLARCLTSIETKTTYMPYEVIVLDNGSTTPSALDYLAKVETRWRVIRHPGPFNYAAINNFGASHAKGDYLLFLNDDTQVIAPEWLTAMVAHGQCSGVGAVGAKLLYPNGDVQHAGVVLGICGVAGHAFRHCPVNENLYHGFLDLVRNCSAVTAACMLVSRNLFDKVGGFDTRLKVEYNDVDLCLRIRRGGYRIVYVPDALLYHHENATRRGGRSPEDEALFRAIWRDELDKCDPYYNPNLTACREDWSLRV